MRLLRSILLATFVLLVTASFGVTKTWIGGTNTNWNTASKWSPSGVPGQGDDVIIGPITGGNNQPTIGNLEMGQWNMPSSLVVDGNAILTITGNITVVASATIEIKGGGTINHSGTSNTTFPGYGSATMTITNGTFSSNGTFSVNSTLTMYEGRFLANDGLNIESGKSLIAYGGYIQVDGELDLKSNNSSFHGGTDSLVINGKLTVSSSCNFYADSTVMIVNGQGNGNVKNLISGNFYTNGAFVAFNTSATTEIGRGGKLYGNSGSVAFDDLATIGNNGQLFVDSATISFS